MNFPHRAFGLLSLAVAASLTVPGQAATAPAPPPIAAFAADPILDQVQVNASGTRLMAVANTDASLPPRVLVYDADDLTAPPESFDLDEEGFRVFAAGWIDDRWVRVGGRRLFTYAVAGGVGNASGSVTDWYDDQVFFLDTKTGKVRQPLKKGGIKRGVAGELAALGNASFVRKLRGTGEVLMAYALPGQPPRFYRVGTERFGARIAYRASEDEANVAFDADGAVRVRQLVETGGEEARLHTQMRRRGSTEWETHFTQHAGTRETIEVLHVSADGNEAIIVMGTADGTADAFTYDLETRTRTLLYDHPTFNVIGAEIDPPTDTLTALVLGGPYGTERVFVQAGEVQAGEASGEHAEAQAALEASFPDGHVRLVSRSAGDAKVVVAVDTPEATTRYYLVEDMSRATPLGGRYPTIDGAIGRTEFTRITARDGLSLPAFVTRPAFGEAPFPTVIHPHGGPWTRDQMGRDADHVALLASRGYLVIQPQFRGSQGWNDRLWKAGDHQWGLAMADDLDDAAAWAVEGGLADPSRVAIWGYSYGGYAAAAAAVRPQGYDYRCAVAAAPVTDMDFVRSRWVDRAGPYLRHFQGPTATGLSPADEAAQAKMPVLLIVGDRDVNTIPQQAERMHAALRREGKPTKLHVVKDHWHARPWWPAQKHDYLRTAMRFLRSECGMDAGAGEAID